MVSLRSLTSADMFDAFFSAPDIIEQYDLVRAFSMLYKYGFVDQSTWDKFYLLARVSFDQ